MRRLKIVVVGRPVQRVLHLARQSGQGHDEPDIDLAGLRPWRIALERAIGGGDMLVLRDEWWQQ